MREAFNNLIHPNHSCHNFLIFSNFQVSALLPKPLIHIYALGHAPPLSAERPTHAVLLAGGHLICSSLAPSSLQNWILCSLQPFLTRKKAGMPEGSQPPGIRTCFLGLSIPFTSMAA